MNDASNDSGQPLIAHLLELRNRLLKAMAAIFVVFLGLFYFSRELYTLVAKPLMQAMPEGTSMIATDVASPFLTPFKLTLISALFIAMPFVLHQVWGFIAPGLYKHEKRLAVPLLASSILLFYGGMAFAYFVGFPLVFGFFIVTGIVGNHNLTFYVCHPYPEKFVQVIRVNSQKANTLNRRIIFIGSFLQHAFVKRQPAQFLGVI